jgi:hypothetical protein
MVAPSKIHGNDEAQASQGVPPYGARIMGARIMS